MAGASNQRVHANAADHATDANAAKNATVMAALALIGASST
jgi:hypothetical protein